jgi:hypothetical protein
MKSIIHYVGRMQSFWILEQVGHIITTKLERVKIQYQYKPGGTEENNA